jgi:choline-sulfatase
MSFMTGRHPHELGLFDNEGHLGSDVPTFAHAFLSARYDTVLSGRIHFVGPDQRHGYRDRIVGEVNGSAYLGAEWRLERILGDLADTPGMGLAGVVKSGPGRTGYHAYDEVVTRATVRWLGDRGRGEHDRPFLLTVGYVAPHCPFVSPPDDFRAHRDAIGYSDLPPPDDHLHPVNAAKRRRWQIDPQPPRDAQWRARVAYYGLCSFLDRQVGTIVTALAESGLREHTIIVGAAKTSSRRRTTLQYNHVHRLRGSAMWDHHNARHYWMPPSIWARFNPAQEALTHWMAYSIPDWSVPGAEKSDD